jgi:hypothetical protein
MRQGDIAEERRRVMQNEIEPMKKHNWHLVAPFHQLWDGVRQLRLLWYYHDTRNQSPPTPTLTDDLRESC